jgi:hypothetical protein
VIGNDDEGPGTNDIFTSFMTEAAVDGMKWINNEIGRQLLLQELIGRIGAVLLGWSSYDY